MAEEYNKPLYVIKLDITAAFDSLSHEALAAFLAEASGCREAELLLEIITQTRVTLSMQGTQWEQALSQGVLQGSSYSAELFARCVDFYLAKTNCTWQEREDTWLTTPEGRKLFLTPLCRRPDSAWYDSRAGSALTEGQRGYAPGYRSAFQL